MKVAKAKGRLRGKKPKLNPTFAVAGLGLVTAPIPTPLVGQRLLSLCGVEDCRLLFLLDLVGVLS